MSSAGQVIGGVVGGVIGFFAGGNVVYGAQIGMMIGGLLDPPKTKGPRLDDLTAQTSVYGAFIPRLYGTVPVFGNVIWIQGDKLVEHEAEDDGKGGPEVTNFEYFATFAVGLCEGPIDGVRRIWIGGQLWYDAGSDDLATIISSNENTGKFTLYTGSDTQTADPLIQADRGAGNVPAYRGLAYIVFDELPLKDYGNTLAAAQVKVEVVKNGTFAAALIKDEASGIQSGWHTTLLAAGNPRDNSGMENFVASGLNYPRPVYWVRTINEVQLVAQIADHGGALAITSSLNDVQYCYKPFDLLDGKKTVAWGKDGTVYRCEIGPTSDCFMFCDGDGFVYFLEVASLNYKIVKANAWLSPGGNDGAGYVVPRDMEVSTTYYNSMLVVWGAYLVEVIKSGGNTTDPMEFTIYETASMTVVDSYTVAMGLPDLGFAITNSVHGLCIVGDTLYIVRLNGATAVYGEQKTRVWQFDLVAKTFIGVQDITHPELLNITAPEYPSIKVEGNIVYWGQRSNYDIANRTFRSIAFNLNALTSSSVALSTVVESECLKSDLLTAGDLDVTELTDPVRGYRVSSLSPLRGGIDPLRKAWPFDAIQRGYKIKFKKRGGASVATITEGELDARAAGAEPGVRISNSREMDLVLPDQLTAQYLDAAREYDVNVAEESR